MFRGSFEHTVDDKGRVNIPSKFRAILLEDVKDERLVLTKFIIKSLRCLDVYPQAAWERFEHELANKPRFGEDFAMMESFYLSNAHECTVDKQGRVLLPPELRDYAGLEKEVVFAGARERFRIWHKETWKQFNEESEKQLTQNPDLFRTLNPTMSA